MTGSVRSVSQSVAMLRLLAEAGTLTLSDMGRTVGLIPSSCLNLLKTLVGEGAVERDARTKYYRLAPAWQAVEVLRTDAAARFIERAQPHMARFAQQSEAAMGLWKIVSDRKSVV